MATDPDLSEARRFLRALDPRDGATFHCQTYSDDKSNNDLSLARVVVVELGASDETLQMNRLASLNRRGAGVFVTPSELRRATVDGKSLRRRDQYARARAIVSDDCAQSCFGMRPSLVVRTSADKLQAYWLLDLDEPPLEEEAFKATVLSATSATEGDPECRPTLEHVFRLPGFWHQKDPARPFMSRVELAGDERWTIADLARLFPPSGAQRRASASTGSDRGTVTRATLARALSALPAVDFKDRRAWFELMASCHHATDGAGVEEFVAWCSTDPAYRHRSRDNFLQWRSLDGRSGNQITVGTLAFLLRSRGANDVADEVLWGSDSPTPGAPEPWLGAAAEADAGRGLSPCPAPERLGRVAKVAPLWGEPETTLRARRVWPRAAAPRGVPW